MYDVAACHRIHSQKNLLHSAEPPCRWSALPRRAARGPLESERRVGVRVSCGPTLLPSLLSLLSDISPLSRPFEQERCFSFFPLLTECSFSSPLSLHSFSLFTPDGLHALSDRDGRVCNIRPDRIFKERMRSRNLIAELPSGPSLSRFFLEAKKKKTP